MLSDIHNQIYKCIVTWNTIILKALNSRILLHSCCKMRVMQCMTYFFCASLQVYTPFRSAQNHYPLDNVRPAGGYIRYLYMTYTIFNSYLHYNFFR